jgi:phospholipid/cholesterol/gamma-HCH transport system permease protein
MISQSASSRTPALVVDPERRFISRTGVAAGAIYWLAWLLLGRRPGGSTALVREFQALGIGALRLVSAASVLVGLIATFQLAFQLQQYGAESLSGRVIGWFAAREIGPLVVGLIVVTRSASSIAGELGSMTANAEIDAIRVMGIDPVKYLVAPKLGALLLALPALTIVSDSLITFGGWIASTFFLRSDTLYYLGEVRSAFALRDFVIGIGKSVLFAGVIGIIAADEGLNAGRQVGAIGVATSRAVVFCLLGVLGADTMVNAVFYFIPGLAR